MLPDIRIASPCSVSWESMTGDDRSRHCSECNRNVYNFAAMTSAEIEQLIAASNGERLCGRLYRRVDGTILTSDCPVGLRRRAWMCPVAERLLPYMRNSSPLRAPRSGGEIRGESGRRQAQITVIDRKSHKIIATGKTDEIVMLGKVAVAQSGFNLFAVHNDSPGHTSCMRPSLTPCDIPNYALPDMLPEIRVASPCMAGWEQMVGNNRVRHCAQCDLDVYNFAAMTTQEIEQLLAASRGKRLCGRLYRRADGTLLTGDCPVGFKVRVKHISRRLAVAMSAALSVGTAIAQAGQNQSASSLVQIEQSTDSSIFGVVTDMSGAVIQNAKISIKLSGRIVAEGTTDLSGRFKLDGLNTGHYEVTASAPGFDMQVAPVDIAQPHQPLEVDLVLTVGHEVMGMIADGMASIPTEPSVVNELLPESSTTTAPLPAKENPASQPNLFKRFFSAVGHKLSF